MITYRENKNDITQSVEIDLTKIPDQSRQDLESKIAEFLKHIDDENKHIFKFEPGNELTYDTEVLIPKVNKSRLNILMVLGNPAIHSVAKGMFFSYEETRVEGKWREHRFWRALRDCEVLRFDEDFDEDIEKPTPKNIDKINAYKRDCLLNRKYESKFNLFLLPYFSFPTPASGSTKESRKYSGVPGIREIVGKEIFKEMKGCEFKRFKGIVLDNNIKHVICFQQSALKEIQNRRDDALRHVILYPASPTRRLYTPEGKKCLCYIIADIKGV